MTTARLEAFSDGVIAIIITIMVLELRPPHDASLAGGVTRKTRRTKGGAGVTTTTLRRQSFSGLESDVGEQPD